MNQEIKLGHPNKSICLLRKRQKKYPQDHKQGVFNVPSFIFIHLNELT
jgi:hypothetical protein